MIYKLPKEKVKFVKPLFKKMQPNHSSLGQYFLGERPGQTFVDDIQNNLAKKLGFVNPKQYEFLLIPKEEN